MVGISGDQYFADVDLVDKNRHAAGESQLAEPVADALEI